MVPHCLFFLGTGISSRLMHKVPFVVVELGEFTRITFSPLTDT
jgi:hypothetical protein